ncbi:hypothetical protein JCGZ_16167 [Jatropha curcas]|uniref:Agenet domain-containing protein n=1 Tax=Jatropha curcas TaxID=180498 RepID=A0A067K616_JATCU|nr:protein AGENET DOMAIN (AGD)-CONTAINING P1 [Jatropha curcas]KDP30488.1 hypothetical protein JCGZ_16167 [Jatropha curcas]
MRFLKNQKVEVCSKEEGFAGSFYEATILNPLYINGNEVFYKVEYKNLLEENETEPLVENVPQNEIRPLPPPLSNESGFSVNELVDVFANDGWWFGRITGKRGSYFSVYFPTTCDHIEYHVSLLRPHQDWVEQKWISYK